MKTKPKVNNWVTYCRTLPKEKRDYLLALWAYSNQNYSLKLK